MIIRSLLIEIKNSLNSILDMPQIYAMYVSYRMLETSLIVFGVIDLRPALASGYGYAPLQEGIILTPHIG
jgi:hypothetical protein